MPRREASSVDSPMLRLLDRELTSEDIQTATDRVSQPNERRQKQTERVLVFSTADQLFGLPAGSVSLVAPVPFIRSIPFRCNEIIQGLCAIEGDLLLCGHLARLLELTDRGSEREAQRVIVIGEEANRWAFTVASVLGVWAVDPDQYCDPPLTLTCAARAYTRRLIPWSDDRYASLLDTQLLGNGFQEALE